MVGVAEEREQLVPEVHAVGEPGEQHGRRVVRDERVLADRARDRSVVHGPVAQRVARDVRVGDAVGRDLGRLVAARRRRVRAGDTAGVEEPVEHPEAAGVGDAPDDRGTHLPALGQRQDALEVRGLHDREHPFLALGRQHLDRVHTRFALRDARHVDVHPRAGLGRGLRRGARQARGTEVLHTDGQPLVEQLQARLDEPLLLERVPHLDRRPLGVGALLEARGGEHARATDPVSPGRRAEQHGEVVRALRAREHEPVLGEQPEAQDVHQRVVAVAVVEHDLAAHRGNPDRVAVPADPRDHALEQVPRARVVERTEAQRVHERDRARAHREDVADDAAHAGRCALVGLDRGRVVVALDADGDGEPVADVDDAGALARPDQDPGRLAREAAEIHPRRLVGAVLGPHDGVHGELELGGLPAQQFHDGAELVVGQAQCSVQWCLGRGHQRSLATG